MWFSQIVVNQQLKKEVNEEIVLPVNDPFPAFLLKKVFNHMADPIFPQTHLKLQ